jgi:hypothetical protein
MWNIIIGHWAKPVDDIYLIIMQIFIYILQFFPSYKRKIDMKMHKGLLGKKVLWQESLKIRLSHFLINASQKKGKIIGIDTFLRGSTQALSHKISFGFPLPDEFFHKNLFTLHFLDPVYDVLFCLFPLRDEYLLKGIYTSLNLFQFT